MNKDPFPLSANLLAYLPFALPLYLIRFKIGPLPTTLLEVCILIIEAIFLLQEGKEGIKRGWKNLDRFRWPIIAWLLTTLLAVFIAPNSLSGFGLWRAYVLEPVTMFLIAMSLKDVYFNSTKHHPDTTEIQVPTSIYLVNLVVQNLFLVTIFFALWALVQFVTGHGIPHPWNVDILAGRRATGPFPYPNAIALFVAPIGALALTKIAIMKEQEHTYLPRVTLAVAFIACLVARSEGGLISLGAATWLALIVQKNFRKYLLIGTVLVGLLIALTPALHKPLIRELTFQGWSGKVRMYMWRDTRAMLKDHWFLGAGFGGYPIVFKPYQKTTGIEVFQYPHNIILNIWSETGLLGLLAFIWVLIIWFRTLKPTTYELLPASLPLFVILLHGLIDVPYFKNDLAILFWLLIWITIQPSMGLTQRSVEPSHT